MTENFPLNNAFPESKKLFPPMTVATNKDILDEESKKGKNNYPATVLDHTSESSKNLLQVREGYNDFIHFYIFKWIALVI